MIRIRMLTGSLEWSLPERVTHRAGASLQVTFRIANPTAAPRSYRIFLALFDLVTGTVIEGTTGPITIGGRNAFEVGSEGELALATALRIDRTGALLQASLYDVASGEMAVGLQSYLDPPPGIGEQIAPVVGFASGVMALGLVAGAVAGATASSRR